MRFVPRGDGPNVGGGVGDRGGPVRRIAGQGGTKWRWCEGGRGDAPESHQPCGQ